MISEYKATKAIFFDRDDTLIIDKGYMFKTEDLVLFPETVAVLKELQSKHFKLFIVTNQSGIGRGFFSEVDMHRFNQELLDQLAQHEVYITDLAFCPHKPEDVCDCRKPSPKLLNELCLKYNIDKEQSYMIGDKESDYLAGVNAGMRSLKVLPGHLKDILRKIK